MQAKYDEQEDALDIACHNKTVGTTVSKQQLVGRPAAYLGMRRQTHETSHSLRGWCILYLLSLFLIYVAQRCGYNYF